MKNIEEILIEHFNKYPKMEIIDAIKIIYQNEFGGGHLISDSIKTKEYLISEYNKVKDDNKDVYIEDIGNGYYRYYLNKLDMSIDELTDLFISSNKRCLGNIDSFNKKLEVLEKLVIDNKTPFDYKTYKEYVEQYKKDGYPIVSHSKTYKDNYHPSYRVIRKER